MFAGATEFGVALEMPALMTGAILASCFGKLGAPGFPASIDFDSRPGRDGHGGYDDALCSLPACRQLGQATDPVSWKRRLCRANVRLRHSFASGIRARRGKTRAAGLQRKPKARPAGRRPKPPFALHPTVQNLFGERRHQRCSRNMDGSASRASAEQQTNMPPAMQKISRQTSEGTASRVTPCTRA